MNWIKKQIKKKESALQARKQPFQERDVPLFGENGKVLRKKRKIPWKALIVLGILSAAAAMVYVPALIPAPPVQWAAPTAVDPLAIQQSLQYLKDHPDGDFDGDGLSNSLEAEYRTNPYKKDSDGDGITDYAELFVTKTSPVRHEGTVMARTAEALASSGESVNSPYRIYDVILWPDNLDSRARGGVIRTLHGYRFCGFTGWVKFEEGEYAYRIVDGVHIPLKRDTKQDVFYIPDDSEIRIYEKALERTIRFTAFGNIFYFDPNPVTEFLAAILPDGGRAFLRCQNVALRDTEPDIEPSVYAEIVQPACDLSDPSRFGGTQNTLEDLVRVRSSIDRGSCVAVSLFSSQYGESLALVYGYTAAGDLLAADFNTLAPLGKLKLDMRAARMMDQRGQFVQYEWFGFDGCGFSSGYGDRISFFAASPERKGEEE